LQRRPVLNVYVAGLFCYGKIQTLD